MANKAKNEPAYPVFPETSGGHSAAFHGMTLRDHFAGLAMQTLINSSHLELGEWWDCTGQEENQNLQTDKLLAATSYMIADAMLSARIAG